MNLLARKLWLPVLLVAILALLAGIIANSLNTHLTGEQTQVKWRFKVNGHTNSRYQDFDPDVGLLAGHGGTVTLLDVNGNLLHQFPDPGQEAATQLIFGPDELIYGATHAGEVYCLTLSGELRWSLQLPGKFGMMTAEQQSECHCAMIALQSNGNLFALACSGDGCVLTPAGEVVSSFHTPQCFYHWDNMVLVNDEVFAAGDKDRTIHLFSTTGQRIADYQCDGYCGEYAARNDDLLLLTKNGSNVTAVDTVGNEVWRSSRCCPPTGLLTTNFIKSIHPLPDRRTVVASERQLTLLSSDGKLLWQRKTPGFLGRCYARDDRWIDCVVTERSGFSGFLLSGGSRADRREFLVRYDLNSEVLGTWELPACSSVQYGPGPTGEYYLSLSAPRSYDEPMRRFPVEIARIDLPTDGGPSPEGY